MKECALDKLGRIVIPKDMRKLLGEPDANGRIEVEIYTSDDKIIIEKTTPQCAICYGKENLVDFKNKKICKDCVDKISEI